MPTKKSKRPNRAAFERALAQVRAEPRSRELPEALAALIDAHEPANSTGRPMHLIRPFIKDVITASTLTGAESVRKHCTHLTEIAAYALNRGLPLGSATVMTTSVIDEYIRIGMADDGDHLRAERRRRLLALAAVVNPGPQAPAKLSPIAHCSIKACYTPLQATGFVRISPVQPTEIRSRYLSTVVACGLGFGMDSIDIRHGRVGDVQDHGTAGMVMNIQGPRPRVVPVRGYVEPLLRRAIAGRPAAEQLLVGKIDRRNTAARATENAARIGLPRIEPARLRATWLADLMTDPIPLAVILQAAGLKSARSLVDLQPHLGPWLEHKGLNNLQDTATVAATAMRGVA